MNRKANLFTRLLGVVALALATSVSAETEGSSGGGTTATPSISPSSQSVSGTVGKAIPATVAYSASNFGGTPGYTVSPALPAGLSLSASTGVISGTPTVASAQAGYTVTAKYGTKTATATVNVTVTAAQASASLTPAAQTVIATVGKSISATTAYQATNFGTAPTFTVQPSLPAGLTLNSGTGVITGTPTVAAAQANYTVTAKSSTAQATAIVTLTVITSGTTPTASTLNCPDPKDAATETAAIQGRRAYLRLNCYGCHSDYGQGGTMGPNIQGAGGDVAEAVKGDGGMPSFTSALCPNDVTNLQAYLGTVKALSASSAPQLLDWKTYPGNKFTTVPAGVAHFH